MPRTRRIFERPHLRVQREGYRILRWDAAGWLCAEGSGPNHRHSPCKPQASVSAWATKENTLSRGIPKVTPTSSTSKFFPTTASYVERAASVLTPQGNVMLGSSRLGRQSARTRQ